MRKLGILVLIPLIYLLATGCASTTGNLGVGPGEGAMLLRFPDGGSRLVAVPVTRTKGGVDTGPQLTFGEVTESGGECNTDDQGNTHCECDWEDTDVGQFSLCMTFAANCEPGTLEPTGDGYTCEGVDD